MVKKPPHPHIQSLDEFNKERQAIADVIESCLGDEKKLNDIFSYPGRLANWSPRRCLDPKTGESMVTGRPYLARILRTPTAEWECSQPNRTKNELYSCFIHKDPYPQGNGELFVKIAIIKQSASVAYNLPPYEIFAFSFHR